MTTGRSPHGFVKGEKPPVLHVFGTLAGRSCCGKVIVPADARPVSGVVVCRRCVAMDTARRAGMPEWY